MQTDTLAHLDTMFAEIAILDGDPADDAPAGELLRTFLLRSDQGRPAAAAITARGAKIARRIPGLVVTPHLRERGSLPYCTNHREFYCSAQSYDPAAWCRKMDMPAVEVEIWADGLPVASGWSVAGVLSADAAGAVTSTTVGDTDEQTVIASRHLAGQCAHCGKIRRRTTTVLLRNVDTFEVRPVGKSCLAEYTGTALTPDMLRRVIGIREAIDDEMDDLRGGGTDVAPTVLLVAIARALTNRFGFVRSTDIGATREHMAAVLVGKHDVLTVDSLVDDDMLTAARADMALIAESTDTSEYITNLQAIIAGEWAVYAGRNNRLGILASLPAAADRARGFAAKRAAELAGRVNAHIGEVKERREFTGTVRTNMLVDTVYGTSRRFTVDTAEGVVTVFGKIAGAEDVEVGAEVTFKASIKAHSEFRGECQTEVIRVALAG